MEKITKSSDKVLIDPNEPLILPDGTALVGRVEWFLYALCCLDYQNLPTPMSRIEEFANALITGEVPNIEPQSRAEQFFLAILDGNVSDLPQPQSRSEVLLDKLARGEFDLSDVEPIQSSYELLLAYLIKNGGIDNIDYVLYEFSEAMKTMYNTVEKPFKSLELSGNTLVNCVLEDTENDDYTSFDEDYSGTSFTINGTSEGAIKSAILKGQTLVNLATNGNRFSTLSSSSQMFTLNLSYNLEKNKKYLIVGETTQNEATVQGVCLMIKRKALGSKYIAKLQMGVGIFSYIVTTDDEITGLSFYIHSDDRDNGKTLTVGKAMVIEYQDGMENWDIPYFEGMQSVKMPVLTTTGKNLFDVKWEEIDNHYISVNPNTTYVFSNNGTPRATHVTQYNSKYETISINQAATNLVTCSNTCYITVSGGSNDRDKFQIEEGSVATSYEPYKTNILTVNEDIELRGICDVQDELNLLTGELTQRVAEIVLDGSESWNIHAYSNDDFLFVYTDIATKKTNNVLCDKFPTWNETAESLRNQTQSYIWANPNKSIFVWIEKSKLSEATTKGFKDYLQSNPIIANYQLKNESIKTVDLNVVDQNNTKIDKIHVFNETTHVNASSDELTPTVNIGKSVSYPTIIKPNTKYTVDLKRNDKPLTVNLGGTEVAFADGETRKTITTPSTLTNDKLSYYGIGAKCNEIMLIEGEIERNVDYFTGMQSVEIQNQMPILSTVGKNLFDGVSYIDGFVASGNNYTVSYDTDVTSILVNVNKNTDYILSAKTSFNRSIIGGSLEPISIGTKTTKIESSVISSNTLKFNSGDYTNLIIYLNNTKIDIEEIQVEEGSVSTTYEPYKSSLLSCNEDVALRGIGDVQDTLDCLTGQVTQHIGEIVFSSSDGFQYLSNQDDGNFSSFEFIKDINRTSGYNGEICDRLKRLTNYLTNENGIYYYGRDGRLELRLDTTNFISRDLNGLNDYLSKNPITLQYFLATPTIKTVDLNVVDQDENTIPKIKSYKDVTHLEVTVPKQSLLPHISAEVATDNSKDMPSLTTKHQEISEAQSAIENNIQSQSDEIDTALMATTEIFESILE